MIETLGTWLNSFDYAIKPNAEYYEAGAYVGLTALKKCKSLVELGRQAKD